MKTYSIHILMAFLVLSLVSSGSAQVTPPLVSYQGRLTDPSGNPVPDNTYTVLFTIYGDPVAAGPIVWAESQSVTTTNGFFAVTLAGTSFDLDWSVLTNLPNRSIAYLGIKVGTDAEMTPRVRLTSVLYAHEATHAGIVNSVNQATGGTITSDLTVTGDLGSENLAVGADASIWGKLAIHTNAGPTTKPEIGERWRDNSIVAWGQVGPDATIFSSFGVDSVQHPSPGHYMIFLSNNLGFSSENVVAVVQAYCSVENPHLATAVPLTASQIEVGIRWLLTNTIDDGAFSFIVTGR